MPTRKICLFRPPARVLALALASARQRPGRREVPGSRARTGAAIALAAAGAAFAATPTSTAGARGVAGSGLLFSIEATGCFVRSLKLR